LDGHGSTNRGDRKGQTFASQIATAPPPSGGSLDRAAKQQLVVHERLYRFMTMTAVRYPVPHASQKYNNAFVHRSLTPMFVLFALKRRSMHNHFNIPQSNPPCLLFTLHVYFFVTKSWEYVTCNIEASRSSLPITAADLKGKARDLGEGSQCTTIV